MSQETVKKIDDRKQIKDLILESNNTLDSLREFFYQFLSSVIPSLVLK